MFEVEWGKQSSTLDKEGDVINESDYITKINEIKNIKKNFVGDIDQSTPIFSAKKINGKRAYELDKTVLKFQLKKVKKKNIWPKNLGS